MSLYMFRALNAHLQEDTLYSAAYGPVTLYESSWWPVGAHFEWELKLYTDRTPRTLVESDSIVCCMYTVYPPEDEHLRL